MSNLFFFIFACLILSELVGISFEQTRLIADNKISVDTSVYVHIFAAPKFLLMTMPYALFMANILTYSNLSKSSEIFALCSFGISINKILMPSLILSVLIAFGTFYFQDVVVIESNYKAAIALEKAMKIDRNIDVSNFVYTQFDNIQKRREINLLLHAKRASNKIMQDVTILSFDRGNLRKVIIAKSASWRAKEKKWQLYQGTEEVVAKSPQLTSHNFKTHDLEIKNTLNQLLVHDRDDNELNIFDLRKKLNIFQSTGHFEEVLKLQRSIQDRFAAPFLCIVFSLVGASIGINLDPKTSNNEFRLGLILILSHYILQFFITALIGNGTIPFWGVWIPSLFGLTFTFFRLVWSSQ